MVVEMSVGYGMFATPVSYPFRNFAWLVPVLVFGGSNFLAVVNLSTKTGLPATWTFPFECARPQTVSSFCQKTLPSLFVNHAYNVSGDPVFVLKNTSTVSCIVSPVEA